MCLPAVTWKNFHSEGAQYLCMCFCKTISPLSEKLIAVENLKMAGFYEKDNIRKYLKVLAANLAVFKSEPKLSLWL